MTFSHLSCFKTISIVIISLSILSLLHIMAFTRSVVMFNNNWTSSHIENRIIVDMTGDNVSASLDPLWNLNEKNGVKTQNLLSYKNHGNSTAMLVTETAKHFEQSAITKHKETANSAPWNENNEKQTKSTSISVPSTWNKQKKRRDSNLAHESRQKILLFTNQRSGSSFVGSLFLQNPEIFYAFEPFKLLEQATTIPNTDHGKLVAGSNDFKYHSFVEQNIVKYLQEMFKCDFDPLIADANRLQPNAREQRQITQWYSITFAKSKLEYNIYPPKVANLKEVCLTKYKHVALKVIRGELIKHIFPVLESEVKVIHMVRDPRGALSSRIKGKNWPKWSKAELDTRLECQHNLENIKFIQEASKDPYKLSVLQQNYRFVRFEDIALNTEEMANKIYMFLNISMPDKVKDFIKADPNVDKWIQPRIKGFMHEETRKAKSMAIVNKWRALLDSHMLTYIETQCLTVMETLGFQPTSREYSRKSKDKQTFVSDLPDNIPFALRPNNN